MNNKGKCLVKSVWSHFPRKEEWNFAWIAFTTGKESLQSRASVYFFIDLLTDSDNNQSVHMQASLTVRTYKYWYVIFEATVAEDTFTPGDNRVYRIVSYHIVSYSIVSHRIVLYSIVS